MAFFTPNEIVDLIVMTVAIGYIFSKIFGTPQSDDYDPLKHYKKNRVLDDIKQGIIIAAPAVVLHELAHKFVAVAFGATATLHAPSLMGIPYGMYLLVIVLIHMNFPFLFFVGGYVSHTALPALQSSLVSVAGPLTNLLLWLLALSVIKYGWVDRKHYNKVVMMGKLNLFFFAFNMIPLPGFDGSNFLMALIRAFF